jgi:hypothetical protein
MNLSFLWVSDYLVSSEFNSFEYKNYDMPIRPTFTDSADKNSKRLLAICKDAKQSRGSNYSIMKVVLKFCRTRVIIASIFYTLSTLLALIAPVFFLKQVLDAIKRESIVLEPAQNSTADDEHWNLFKLHDLQFNFHLRIECVLYMLAFVACMLSAKILTSITVWLNLRTSIRLRTAVVAARFRQSLKSSIMINISPHQILSNDTEVIMDLMEYLPKVLGSSFGLLISLITTVIMLKGPGAWPILSCIGFLCFPVLLALISANFHRKGTHYHLKKINIIESLCINFKEVMVHSLSYGYIKLFYCKLTVCLI